MKKFRTSFQIFRPVNFGQTTTLWIYFKKFNLSIKLNWCTNNSSKNEIIVASVCYFYGHVPLKISRLAYMFMNWKGGHQHNTPASTKGNIPGLWLSRTCEVVPWTCEKAISMSFSAILKYTNNCLALRDDQDWETNIGRIYDQRRIFRLDELSIWRVIRLRPSQ